MSNPPIDVIHSPAGKLGRLRRHGRENCRDRIRILEPRIVARPKPERDDVVVVVDQAGDYGSAAQIDALRARGALRASADGCDSIADYVHGFDDGVARIQRVNAAVDEQQIATERALIVLCGRGCADAKTG